MRKKVNWLMVFVVLAIVAIIVAIVLPVIGTVDTRQRIERNLPLTGFDRAMVSDRIWSHYPLAYGKHG